MSHKAITQALRVLAPNTDWTLSGDNIDDIQWLDQNQSKPTKAQIEAEMANPTPQPDPTIADKLAMVGLSIDELKAALA